MIWNPDFDYRGELSPIADAYAALIWRREHGHPDDDPYQEGERDAWHLLMRHSVYTAAQIRARRLPVALYPDGRRMLVDVSETADPEPYPDAAAMLDDLRGGHFLVSTANCDHPIWTPAENVAFRIVHDVIGHGTSGGDFGWAGEVAACGVHFPLLPYLRARQALFTECIAQTAYACDRGGFGPQVVGFLRPRRAFVTAAEDDAQSIPEPDTFAQHDAAHAAIERNQ